MVEPTDIQVKISPPADETSEDEPKVTTFVFSHEGIRPLSSSWDPFQVTGPEDLAPRTRAAYEPSVSEMGLLPTYQRLAQLTQLEPDWDSYGAAPVSDGAIAAAHEFLSLMSGQLLRAFAEHISPYTVAPLADGGIQIEWRGRRSALELEIDPAGVLSGLLMQHHETGRTYQEHDKVSSREAVDLVAQTLQS